MSVFFLIKRILYCIKIYTKRKYVVVRQMNNNLFIKNSRDYFFTRNNENKIKLKKCTPKN